MAELLQDRLTGGLRGPDGLRRSPLAGLEELLAAGDVDGSRGVRLRERPFLTMVGIRAVPGSESAARIGAVIGVPLPLTVGETTSAGPHTVLWLAPDEWLLVSASVHDGGPDSAHDVVPALVPPLVEALAEALGDARGAVVDVSANRTTLELTGPAARSVLVKGCPVDLHPRAFGPGRAVATTLGPVPLLLWQTGPTSYRLLPRSSFAEYVARWVLDAMTEYAGPELP